MKYKQIITVEHHGSVTLSSVRKANEDLIKYGVKSANALLSMESDSEFTINAVHSGRNYELKLSRNQIKEAYAKSLEKVFVPKR